jgi:hypothetical protein
MIKPGFDSILACLNVFIGSSFKGLTTMEMLLPAQDELICRVQTRCSVRSKSLSTQHLFSWSPAQHVSVSWLALFDDYVIVFVVL